MGNGLEPAREQFNRPEQFNRQWTPDQIEEIFATRVPNPDYSWTSWSSNGPAGAAPAVVGQPGSRAAAPAVVGSSPAWSASGAAASDGPPAGPQPAAVPPPPGQTAWNAFTTMQRVVVGEMQGARSAAEEAKSAAEDAKSAAEEARDEAAQARTAVASIFELLQTMHHDVLDKFGTMSDEVKREREMQQEAVEKATGAASRSFLEAKGVLDKAEATRSAVHLVQGEVRDMKGKVEAMHSAFEEIKSSKTQSMKKTKNASQSRVVCPRSRL